MAAASDIRQDVRVGLAPLGLPPCRPSSSSVWCLEGLNDQMSTFRIALANIRLPATPAESVTLVEHAIARASIERYALSTRVSQAGHENTKSRTTQNNTKKSTTTDNTERTELRSPRRRRLAAPSRRGDAQTQSDGGQHAFRLSVARRLRPACVEVSLQAGDEATSCSRIFLAQ